MNIKLRNRLKKHMKITDFKIKDKKLTNILIYANNFRLFIKLMNNLLKREYTILV
jgi:hypothetical protein